MDPIIDDFQRAMEAMETDDLSDVSVTSEPAVPTESTSCSMTPEQDSGDESYMNCLRKEWLDMREHYAMSMDLVMDSTELARAGRCFQLAWKTITQSYPKYVQDSMAGTTLLTSSSCSGAYTAEMALGAKRYEQGPTATVFMSHAKRHKEKRTPLLIIENVQVAEGERIDLTPLLLPREARVLRQDPDELQEIFSNEYNRRGRPVEHTQWDPDTVRRYMRYRLSKLRVGQNCGCYKHNLPAAGADNTPAPLPAEVIAWEKSSEGVPKKSSKVTAHEPLDGEDIRDPEEKYLSDAAVYELDLDKETDCYTLRHCETGDEVVLDDLPKGGKYRIYKTETGLTCLWAGVDSRPEYACDVFLQAAFETSQPQADNKTKKRGLTGVTDDNDSDPEASDSEKELGRAAKTAGRAAIWRRWLPCRLLPLKNQGQSRRPSAQLPHRSPEMPAVKKVFWETLDGSTVLRLLTLTVTVYLKAINHVLLWVADVTYVDFMPSKVIDEEKCQNKALNIILQQTHVRAFADADCCHIKWNTIKNSLNSTGLDMVITDTGLSAPLIVTNRGICFDREMDAVDLESIRMDAEQFMAGEPDAESDLSNNDEEEGDADSQPAAAANSKSKSGPKTKSELYKYFSGKGADWDSAAGRTFSFIPEYAKMFDMNNTSMPEPDSEDSILLPKPVAY
ncbi:unnamed protein product [Effrenium voratum]|nr:unnamed protein product [Effrenium voratum]